MDNNKIQKIFDTLEPFLKDEDDIKTFTSWKVMFEENTFFEEIQKMPKMEKLSAIFDGLTEKVEKTILTNYDMPETERLYLHAYKDVATSFARLFSSTEKSKQYMEDNLKKLKEKLDQDFNIPA